MSEHDKPLDGQPAKSPRYCGNAFTRGDDGMCVSCNASYEDHEPWFTRKMNRSKPLDGQPALDMRFNERWLRKMAKAEDEAGNINIGSPLDGAGQQGEPQRCGAQNDGFTCNLPKGHAESHQDVHPSGNGGALGWANREKYGEAPSAPPVAEDGLPVRYTDEDAKEWNRRLGEVGAAHPSTDKRTNLPLIKTMNVVGKTLVAQLREALRKQPMVKDREQPTEPNSLFEGRPGGER